jgi:hypothetical protein
MYFVGFRLLLDSLAVPFGDSGGAWLGLASRMPMTCGLRPEEKINFS